MFFDFLDPRLIYFTVRWYSKLRNNLFWKNVLQIKLRHLDTLASEGVTNILVCSFFDGGELSFY